MTLNNQQQLVDELESALAQQLKNDALSDDAAFDGSHDIHHSRRVLENALQIAAGETTDQPLPESQRLLVAGAYLHDWVNVPKNSPERANASKLSADAAVPILKSLGFDSKECESVSHMILTHSFSANIKPETLEAKILQDADRLEAIGAIGIARVFYIAGKLNSALFDGNDPFAANRDLDDKTYALDHFRVKLLGLPDTMQTRSGKELALQRSKTMMAYLDAIALELNVQNPW